MPKAILKQKDMLNRSVDQIDLQGIKREGLFWHDGIIRQLSARLVNKVLEAEMDAALVLQEV